MAEDDLALETFLRIERRQRRDAAIRTKHGLSVATTISYAIVAGAIWKPLFEQTCFTILGVVFSVFAFGILVGSFYLAPLGEFDAQR